MTKQIRIENADTSDYKVGVFVEHLIEGTWVRLSVEPIALGYPTAMHQGYIHSNQRLVVEEIA